MKKYEHHRQTIGRKRTKEYMTWQRIIQRCHNPKNPNFEDYGARGITVCKQWRESFVAFLTDMGQAPKGMSIERKDNSLGYCKSNCRWATHAEQMQNTRAVRMIEYSGKTMGLAAWSRVLGINKESLRMRLNKMPIEEAFTLPTKKDHRRKTTQLNKI